MKYVSLVEVMRIYGMAARKNKGARVFGNPAIGRPFSDTADYRPFVVEQETDDSTGQVMNKLSFNPMDRNKKIGEDPNCDVFFSETYESDTNEFLMLPPILELQWLFKVAELDDASKDILTQLGYAWIVHVLGWSMDHKMGNPGWFRGEVVYDQAQFIKPGTWMEELVAHDAIVEAEELDDTPRIMFREKLPSMTMYKTARSWYVSLLYGMDYRQLMRHCLQLSQSIKELYLHMPVLAAMFMYDVHNRFSGWTKDERLQMESTLNDRVARIEDTVNDAARMDEARQTCTYGRCHSITLTDSTFLHGMLKWMYDAIKKVNKDIGTISIYNYRFMHDPQDSKTIHAIVQVGSILDWNEEMKRAKQEG